MIDKTTDIANTEQVVVVFRWVNSELSVHEEFVGLYRTESLQALSLVQILTDVMLRLNLKIGLCRGQCYDGASLMSGTKNGVAKLICDDEPRAVYTHCYGHALNLAVNDMLKQCRTLKSCLETVNEIIKLVKNHLNVMQSFKGSNKPLHQKAQVSGFYVPQDGLFMHLRCKVS